MYKFLKSCPNWSVWLLDCAFQKVQKIVRCSSPSSTDGKRARDIPIWLTSTLFEACSGLCVRALVESHTYLLPGEFLHVHQDPHQLRDGQGRMSVIQLDGHLQTTGRQRRVKQFSASFKDPARHKLLCPSCNTAVCLKEDDMNAMRVLQWTWKLHVRPPNSHL